MGGLQCRMSILKGTKRQQSGQTRQNVTSSAILDLINMHFDSSMTFIY